MPTVEAYNGYHLWNYIPSRPAAIIFIAVFAILTAGRTWRMLRHRMWFCIPFVVGGAFEVIGYALRAIAYDKTGELIPYVFQSSFLLLGPVLFAASLYMTLGRVIRAMDGEALSLIQLRWLTRIFVAGDVVSFIVQASGAAMKSQVKDINPSVGTNIVVGGLVFQVIIFGIFMVVAAVFNRHFRNSGGSSHSRDIPWQAALSMLYATSAMIMARNVFRVVGYTMGNDGYLLSVEWPVYVFDAGLMSFTMACFFWWYPDQLMPALGGQVVKSEDSTSADIELLQRVSDLDGVVKSMGLDSDPFVQLALTSALERLISCVADLGKSPASESCSMNIKILYIWPSEVSQAFFDLVRARHPLAVIILSHDCCLIRWSSSASWFCRGWGRPLAHCVMSILEDSDLTHLAEWSVKVMSRDE